MNKHNYKVHMALSSLESNNSQPAWAELAADDAEDLQDAKVLHLSRPIVGATAVYEGSTGYLYKSHANPTVIVAPASTVTVDFHRPDCWACAASPRPTE